MFRLSECTLVTGAHATFSERRAAAFLSRYIRIVTGAAVPTVTDEAPAAAREIIVGKTSRPGDAEFVRSREGLWKYRIFCRGDAVYLSGLGTAPAEEPPYNTAYRHLDDGGFGTVIAAYRFVTDVLGCDFLNEAYTEYPRNPEAAVPVGYAAEFTLAYLQNTMPTLTRGPLVCSLNISDATDWNMSGTVLKTASGKLIVIDGGRPEETEHLYRVIRALSDTETPVISAWFFTHLHLDHWGAVQGICDRPEFRDRLKVEHFYHHLLSEEFYTTLGKEPLGPSNLEARRTMLAFDRVFPGCEVHEVSAGDRISVDGFDFEVLRVPDPAKAALMNTNDTSVVLRMQAAGQTWLWLADCEWVGSGELAELPPEKLKCDVVQVGHHGCGNVSREIYARAGARASLWQIGPKFLYSDIGEGLNSHNTGVIRTRLWLRELGMDPRNDHIVMNDIFETPLPMEIV